MIWETMSTCIVENLLSQSKQLSQSWKLQMLLRRIAKKACMFQEEKENHKNVQYLLMQSHNSTNSLIRILLKPLSSTFKKSMIGPERMKRECCKSNAICNGK